jgi:hypothetical protein
MHQFDNPDRDFSASPGDPKKDTDAWAQPVPGIFDDPTVRERIIQLIVKVVSGQNQRSYW